MVFTQKWRSVNGNITIDDVGNAAVFLGSDLSARTTGEIFYVDAGYSIMGVPNVE